MSIPMLYLLTLVNSFLKLNVNDIHLDCSAIEFVLEYFMKWELSTLSTLANVWFHRMSPEPTEYLPQL